MTDPLTAGKKKIIYIEFLRILAIVFVLFNHTKNNGYTYFTLCNSGCFTYWFCMFFSVFCKFSVPVFFMISGMMLLGKEESLGTLWKKRIIKYFGVLVLFSLFQYLWKTLPAGRAFSIKEFLILFYSKGIVEVYWFLYLYLAFLIMLPFIRKIALNLKPAEFNYLIVIQLVFGGLLYITDYLIFKGSVSFNSLMIPSNVIGLTVFYPLIGYFIGNKVKSISNKAFTLTLVLFLVSIAVTMLMTDFRIKVTGDTSVENIEYFYSSLQSFQVLFIFIAVRKVFENMRLPGYAEQLVYILGGSVFGIYLIEKMVREALWGVFEKLNSVINTFASNWLYILIVFFVSALISAAFKYLLSIMIHHKETQ